MGRTYETFIVSVVCPILSGLNFSVWAAMAIHAEKQGYNLSLVGFSVACAYALRLCFALLTDRFKFAASFWAVSCTALCSLIGLIFYDTLWGFLITIVASIATPQNACHHMIIRGQEEDDSRTRRLLSRYEGVFSVSYCIGAVVGGLLYDYGPLGKESWENQAALSFLVAFGLFSTSFVLTPVRRAVRAMVACKILREEEVAVSTRSANIENAVENEENARRDKNLTMSFKESENETAPTNLPWYTVYVVSLAILVISASVTAFWNMFALFMKEAYGWNATLSNTLLAIGDLSGGLSLMLLHPYFEQGKRRVLATGDDNAAKPRKRRTPMFKKMPVNIGICFVISGVAALALLVHSEMAAVCAQIVISIVYVLSQYTIASAWIKLSEGDAAVFDRLTLRSWKLLTIGCFLAGLSALSLYEVSRTLPFLILGLCKLLIGLGIVGTFVVYFHNQGA